MLPTRYRWDVYADRKTPTPWLPFHSWGRLARALRALRMPQERIRIEYDNGQQVVVKTRQQRPT